MAEAVAVVGLISAIATLVEISAKVICRIHEFTSKTSEVPELFRSLAIWLPLLTATLQRIRVQAENGRLPLDIVRNLSNTILDSLAQVRAVQRCLLNILPAENASRLDQALKAFKSLSKEKKVRQTLKNLEKNNDILQLHQTTWQVETGDLILAKLSKLTTTPIPGGN